jgi:hypothetical protein
MQTALTCATKRGRGHAGRHVHLAEAEVDEADVALRVEHHVLRLQVAVDDVARVQELERAGDLAQVEPGGQCYDHYLSGIFTQLSEKTLYRFFLEINVKILFSA